MSAHLNDLEVFLLVGLGPLSRRNYLSSQVSNQKPGGEPWGLVMGVLFAASRRSWCLLTLVISHELKYFPRPTTWIERKQKVSARLGRSESLSILNHVEGDQDFWNHVLFFSSKQNTRTS